jgi:hypothetical protein
MKIEFEFKHINRTQLKNIIRGMINKNDIIVMKSFHHFEADEHMVAFLVPQKGMLNSYNKLFVINAIVFKDEMHDDSNTCK